ncbi:MAG: hypothetical protein E7588_04335 [Ruminococcaceae bacterium]|nr:hypothetical protein [Oscillospiraceae bacterium]
MRTIVINTSREAMNTRLDILFKAPFDQNSLLWYNIGLSELQNAACEIKQALITDTDTVDRDYNLIVLVDLYNFPHGNEKDAVSIYKALITRYVGITLVNRLYGEFDLIPSGTSVYFADSAELENDWSAEKLAANPVEQKRIEAAETSRVQEKTLKRSTDDLEDDDFSVTVDKTGRDNTQKLIMKLFGWTEDISAQDFKWQLNTSITEEQYLDLTDTFKVTADSISKSDKSAKVLDIALESVTGILSDRVNGEWNTPAVSAKLPEFSGRGYVIYALTCRFERDNEQSLIESYFNIFANIFSCVQNQKLNSSVKKYNSKQIRAILTDALKKYRHFSDERNIEVDFEPVSKVFEKREEIYKKRRETAKEYDSEFRNKTPEEVADIIMSEKHGSSEHAEDFPTYKMRGIDKEFYTLVADIFDNYDTEIINEQNNRIVKTCLKGLWSWRDKQTGEDFKRVVDAVVPRNSHDEDGSASADIALMEEQYEREYTNLINSVTETEHKLAANRNILLETKDLIIKYSDLMRKGRNYLICTVGAVVAVCAAALPYIYVQAHSINENFVHRILYILFTAGFAVLYGTASGIYIGKINKEKRVLKDSLEELKKKSEEERRSSIAALYTFYSRTVVETENHCLLWREISRRQKENSRKCIKRNNHKKRLEKLAGAVERFMTMLKISVDDEEYYVTGDDRKRYEADGLSLNAGESFYSNPNYKVYSVLPVNTDNSDEKGEEQ